MRLPAEMDEALMKTDPEYLEPPLEDNMPEGVPDISTMNKPE